jgi:hypothetical protein
VLLIYALVIQADADGATDIEDLDGLVNAMKIMEDENADSDHPLDVGLVVGSRYVGEILVLHIVLSFLCSFVLLIVCQYSCGFWLIFLLSSYY